MPHTQTLPRAALLALVAALALGQPGDFEPIEYPGAAETIASAINDRGDVVGPATMPDGKVRGFLLRATRR